VKKVALLTAEEAAALIPDGATVSNVSMTMLGTSNAVYKAIEKRFLETGHPRDLTLFHTAGFSDRREGMAHFAHKGLLRRVIGSHWGLCPALVALIANHEIEAYNYPLGVTSNMFHAMCEKLPFTITKVGLGTYLDPRIEGGKMNAISKEALIQLTELDGEEYLLYRNLPIDVMLLRGSYADEEGNITAIDEGAMLENPAAALAAKRYGGKVIVQVKGLVPAGSIPPKEVDVPGVLVDAVVVCADPETDHRQTSGWFQDDRCTGLEKTVLSAPPPAPLNERKVILRRAAMELTPYAIINTGTGMPTDVMGPLLAEEGADDLVMLTVESGIYGGVTAGGVDFGISIAPTAIIRENNQFDLYDGAGVDFAFMGAGEMDAEGNINVTRMNDMVPGAGGFVNITSNAKTVLFCATFTGRGLAVSFDEESGLRIRREGSLRKLVKKVRQISYNGAYNTARGQRALYITERAVFALTPEGPVLTEIAKGVDLERDILANMDFTPRITPTLKRIDPSVYRDGRFGLRELILNNAR